MKNKNKGFTLIELLVVVAIIGILAAVGTVAYTGYTASAKKSAAKSNHANVVKYVAAEMAKCNIESTAFDGWACSNKSSVTAGSSKTTGNPAEAAALALSDFKDPYGESDAAVTADVTGAHVASTTKGVTLISSDGDTVQISTCISVCTGTDPAPDVKSNIVGIE